MKKLEVNQMENLEGGNDCHDRVYGWATGIVVASLFGGPATALLGGTVASLVFLGSVACGGKY